MGELYEGRAVRFRYAKTFDANGICSRLGGQSERSARTSSSWRTSILRRLQTVSSSRPRCE